MRIHNKNLITKEKENIFLRELSDNLVYQFYKLSRVVRPVVTISYTVQAQIYQEYINEKL